MQKARRFARAFSMARAAGLRYLHHRRRKLIAANARGRSLTSQDASEFATITALFRRYFVFDRLQSSDFSASRKDDEAGRNARFRFSARDDIFGGRRRRRAADFSRRFPGSSLLRR